MAKEKNLSLEETQYISSVGGQMKKEYYNIKGLIEYFNVEFLPFLTYLGFYLDLDLFFDCIKKGLKFIENEWVAKQTVAVLTKEGNPLQDETKEFRRRRKSLNATHRAKFSKIYNDYVSEFGAYPSPSPFAELDTMKIFYPSFEFNPEEGIHINAKMFRQIYFSFAAAAKSKTMKAHNEAADTLNAFFGIEYKITEEEFFKYFVFDGGSIRPNPTSINLDSYARLGKIGRKKATRIKI